MLMGLSGYTEQLPGGRASGRTPADFDPVQLARGVEVEYEHTPRYDIAREIAMDHLAEDPLYYEKLAMIDPHHNLGCCGPSPARRTSFGGPPDAATGLWAVAIGLGLIAAGAALTRQRGY